MDNPAWFSDGDSGKPEKKKPPSALRQESKL